MKDEARFASVMASMALVLKMFGRELTADFQEVYWVALADLSDEEFQRAAAILIRRETEFPPPAMFLEVGRPQEDVKAVALRVMQQAWWRCKTYDPESGTGWKVAMIQESFGVAARQGFEACGGDFGFRMMDDEYHGPGIRRAFVEAYEQATRNDPRTALPSPERGALPRPSTASLTRGDS